MGKRPLAGLGGVVAVGLFCVAAFCPGICSAGSPWPTRDDVLKGLKPDAGLEVRYQRREIVLRMNIERAEEAIPELDKALKNICPDWDGLRQALVILGTKWKGTWSQDFPYNHYFIRVQMSHPSFIVMFKYRKT